MCIGGPGMGWLWGGLIPGGIFGPMPIRGGPPGPLGPPGGPPIGPPGPIGPIPMFGAGGRGGPLV